MDSDFISRPPKPQPLKVFNTTPVVPDVSLMFDSDDSLVWQPPKKKDISTAVVYANDTNAPNYKVNAQEKIERRPAHHKIQWKENVPEHITIGYNPLTYCSYKSDKEYNGSLPSAPWKPISNEVNCPAKEKMYNKNIENVSNSISSLKYADHSNKFLTNPPVVIDKMSYKQTVANNGPIYFDAEMYNLIENQNAELIQLKKTVESFLEKQKRLEEKSLEYNTLQKEYSDANTAYKKIAITQTSFLDRVSETRSVAVNTDFTWSEILNSLKEEVGVNFDTTGDKQTCVNEVTHRKCEENNNGAFMLGRKMTESYDTKYTMDNVHDLSLSLQGIDVNTMHEDCSPDPSLHLNLPDYYYNEAEETDDNNGGENYINCEESPAISASFYQREKFCQKSGNVLEKYESCTNKDPSNTFYNEVLANINKLLKNSENTGCKHQANLISSNDNSARKETDVKYYAQIHSQDEDIQVEGIRKQLTEFGISFIDPQTIAYNRRQAVDTFYFPEVNTMLSLYQCSSGLQATLTPYNDSDATAMKYLTDAQLANIATYSKAGRNAFKEKFPSDNEVAYNMNQNYLSMASKDFLNKYGLN